MSFSKPVSSIVALRADRIVAVGRAAEVGRLISPGTEVIDLAGRRRALAAAYRLERPTLGSTVGLGDSWRRNVSAPKVARQIPAANA